MVTSGITTEWLANINVAWTTTYIGGQGETQSRPFWPMNSGHVAISLVLISFFHMLTGKMAGWHVNIPSGYLTYPWKPWPIEIDGLSGFTY